MPRLFRCKSLPHAHIIRSFLLEHDIEAHVIHENASALWCGAVAGSVLSVHETDLSFVMDAFSAPREQLTDDFEIPESDFSEVGPGPLRFDGGFFLSLTVTGAMFALGFAILALVIEFVLSIPERLSEFEPGSLERRPHFEIAYLLYPLGFGALGGVLVGFATAIAREFCPDERGNVGFGSRCVILLILWWGTDLGPMLDCLLYPGRHWFYLLRR